MFYIDNKELLVCKDSIDKAFEIMKETYEAGGKILLCGNGGSCADCDHIVGELMKGFLSRRELTENEKSEISTVYPEIDTGKLQRAVPAISLPSQTAVISAFANDVDAEMVYAQMVFGYGMPGDTVIGISTSGNSKNVVNAMKVASARGLKTIGLTGENKCTLDEICDVVIKAPESETYKIQEYHLPIYHYLCAKLEKEIFM